jgi:hypothetical protein
MVSWAAVAFECRSSADRRRLLRWFERSHPVQFPIERYSVRAALDGANGRRPAEYAWLDRYLYVTTPGDPSPVVVESAETGHWRRAAVAELDRETATAVEGRLLRASDTSDALDGTVVRGTRGLAGLGLVYALAMHRQFRFRPCAARTPDDAPGTYFDAFTDPATLADDLQSFVRSMADHIGVAPTDEGLDLLRSDPAGRDRFVYDGPGGRSHLASPERDAAADEQPNVATAESSSEEQLQTDGGCARDESSLFGRLRSVWR